jgi:hypothetical protein
MRISEMSLTSKLVHLSLLAAISLLPLVSAQADPIVLSGSATVLMPRQTLKRPSTSTVQTRPQLSPPLTSWRVPGFSV